MKLQRFTYSERPDLAEALEKEEAAAFPEFLLHDPIWNECWPHLLDDFADLQTVIYDADREVVVGGSNAVPISWDGTVEGLPAGTHGAMRESIAQHAAGIEPNTVCGVQAVATQAARGQGLSEAFVRFGRERVEEGGFAHSITPLRLLTKDRYPTFPIDEFIGWTRPDGEPFDPWLRVWLRAGAQVLKVCRDSLVIEGSLAEWESWTGLELPVSGSYVFEGGQVPLEVDRERGRGRYSESHVWIKMPVGPS